MGRIPTGRSRGSNPRGLTKRDLGLGQVKNVDTTEVGNITVGLAGTVFPLFHLFAGRKFIRTDIRGGETFTFNATSSTWLGELESYTWGDDGRNLNNIYLSGPGNNKHSEDYGYLFPYDVRIVGGTASWTTFVTSGTIRIRRIGVNVSALLHPGGSVQTFSDLTLNALFTGDIVNGFMEVFLDNFNTRIRKPTVTVWVRREES